MKPEVGTSIDFSDLPPVPEGMYECIVKSYKVVDNPFYHSKPYTSEKPVTRGKTVYHPGDLIPADPDYMATQYQFVFEIDEEKSGDVKTKGRWLFKRTGTMLTKNERNHMYKLFSKVVDQDYLDSLIDDSDAPDIDEEIIGKPVICVVEIVNNKGKKANKVTGFMRSSREINPLTGEDADEEDIPF